MKVEINKFSSFKEMKEYRSDIPFDPKKHKKMMEKMEQFKIKMRESIKKPKDNV